jgi:hypothetical protein
MSESPSSLNPEPILLKSSRLAVEIAAPGTAYRGCRFDWNGFVTQVTLDGAHSFCVPESYTPGKGTGGIGLCNEYTHDVFAGYPEARVGDAFPKLGIGLVKRQDEGPYNVFMPQEIAALFPVSVSSSASEARFVVEPLDCRGLAVREEKVLRVEDNALTITSRMENTGTRPMLVYEYMHPFLGIDRQPIGPDYVVTLPYAVDLAPTPRIWEPGVLRIEGQTVGFNRPPTSASDFYIRPQGAVKTGQAQWELRLQSSGVGLREVDDFSPHHLSIWGVMHVISLEVFVEINLQPGEEQTWTRRFEFFD